MKICVKMGASWLAQVFKQACDTPSGPGAFLLLFFLKTWRTSSYSYLQCRCGGEGGCRRCEWFCGEVFRTGVGCFFKPAIELIQIVWQLLILQSAGGWCLVSGDVFHTFAH